MRETGKISKNGYLLKEGDWVLKLWGFINDESGMHNEYMYHQIVVKPAHMMSNNEMHDDGDGIIFCLGESYNFWDGDEVIFLPQDTVKKLKDFGFYPDKKFGLKAAKKGQGIPYKLPNIFK